MPTTAVVPPDEGRAHCKPLKLVSASHEVATPSLESGVCTFISTSIASGDEEGAPIDVERVVEELLRPTDRLRQLTRSRVAPRIAVSSSAAGTTLLTMPMRSASAALRSSPKNTSSFALCRPTRRGRIRDAAVGDEAAAHEHVDQARGVGRDDEIGREREHHAATGRGAVERAQHRLLAVLDRFHEPLESGPHRVDRGAATMSGAPSGLGSAGGRVRRSAPVQKCFSPAPVMTMARTARFAVRVDEVFDQAKSARTHVGIRRFARVGAIDREPQHTGFEPREEFPVTPIRHSCAHHQCVEGDDAARACDERD